MSSVKWKIRYLDMFPAGSGDSVEITRFGLSLSDSTGTGISEREDIDWSPRESLYYSDSATARAITQSIAFDDWLEVDSEHTDWMKAAQWSLKTKIWKIAHEMGDSDRPVKTVLLNDSAEVVNPLGL